MRDGSWTTRDTYAQERLAKRLTREWNQKSTDAYQTSAVNAQGRISPTYEQRGLISRFQRIGSSRACTRGYCLGPCQNKP